MLLKSLASVFYTIALITCSTLSYGLNGYAKALQTPFNISSNNLALIVNDADPSSEYVANYYQLAHDIPDENIIHVTLKTLHAKLSVEEFNTLSNYLHSKLLPQHHAVLFVWHSPYQVKCQSLTSAFTLGLDPNICAKTCGPSNKNPFFNGLYTYKKQTHTNPISMLLPTQDIDVALNVIDQGVLSKQGVFQSHAYYLKTSDKARNSRAIYFPKNGVSFKRTGLSVINKHAEYLIDTHDIMIYQTGAAHVKHLPTLTFLPGALADHLTSFGGKLDGAGQMSVMAWLRAGATASYGTVSEPCNYWQKFPNSSVLLRWYVAGDTAIEAYWKSVAWPAQGLFVGDPLAHPFGTSH